MNSWIVFLMCYNPWLSWFILMLKLLQVWALGTLFGWLLQPFDKFPSVFEPYLACQHNKIFQVQLILFLGSIFSPWGLIDLKEHCQRRSLEGLSLQHFVWKKSPPTALSTCPILGTWGDSTLQGGNERRLSWRGRAGPCDPDIQTPAFKDSSVRAAISTLVLTGRHGSHLTV